MEVIGEMKRVDYRRRRGQLRLRGSRKTVPFHHRWSQPWPLMDLQRRRIDLRNSNSRQRPISERVTMILLPWRKRGISMSIPFIISRSVPDLNLLSSGSNNPDFLTLLIWWAYKLGPGPSFAISQNFNHSLPAIPNHQLDNP